MCDSMPLYVGRRGELFVTRAADLDNAMHHGAMMERRSISRSALALARPAFPGFFFRDAYAMRCQTGPRGPKTLHLCTGSVPVRTATIYATLFKG